MPCLPTVGNVSPSHPHRSQTILAATRGVITSSPDIAHHHQAFILGNRRTNNNNGPETLAWGVSAPDSFMDEFQRESILEAGYYPLVLDSARYGMFPAACSAITALSVVPTRIA
jgi:hypothetical protein